jgi:DNA-binding CsgD family transcriptional regulator
MRSVNLAWRARKYLALGPVEQVADAVFRPTGTVLHATGAVKDRPALQALRAAVLAREERRRTAARSVSGAAVWSHLVEGRWSLVDDHESGQRYVLALRSDAYADTLALTRREALAVDLAIRGRSTKDCVDELGVSLSAVYGLRHSAARKLSVGSLADVVALGRQLAGAQLTFTALGDQSLVALRMPAQTADGANTNVGIAVTRRPATGTEERLVSGNEIARHYRDEAFFEVTSSASVPMKVVSKFGMEDYLMGVFANGTPVPSPAFRDCPTVMPLTLGQPTTLTLGASGTSTEEQWFLVDLGLGNYEFVLDATLPTGMSSNLGYAVEVLDRFGEVSRAKRIVVENEIGVHFTAQGMLAVGEAGPYWVRLRNGYGELNVTMTVSNQ